MRRTTRFSPLALRVFAASVAALLAVGQIPGTITAAKKSKPRPQPMQGLFADLAPANPFFIVVKQPDGTAIRAKLNGAEIGGHLETPEGYTIVKGENGWWYYAGRADGANVTPSKRRAGIDPPAGLKPGLGRVPSIWAGKAGQLRDQTFRMLQMANYQAQKQAAITGQLPRVFNVPFLLIATYWDPEKGQTGPSFEPGHDVAYFEKLLDGFGGNPTGTMTEFWLENSYGQLLVNVDIFGPYTSYRSAIDRCYYGNVEAENQGETPNILNRGEGPVTIDDEAIFSSDEADDDTLELPAPVGAVPRLDDLDVAGNFLGVGGVGAVGMAVEAVPQADADIDFAKYDNDQDGFVDFTGFIHSGPDMAATGDPCQTWSHAFEVSFLAGAAADILAGQGVPVPEEVASLKFGVPTLDVNDAGIPVSVNRVFTMPETNLDIGVAVHEMMHALGEPDYYNPSYTSAGTGDWDIMAGGSWFGNPPGSNPIGAQPATKAFQGWLTPTVVQADLRNIKLAPRELVPFKGYDVTKVDPNILLVPIAWTDSTAPVDVYGLVKDPKNGKYITEGWYIENISRSVTSAPDFKEFKRSPYFDRLALSSGLLIWHFDYNKKSNTYYGQNDAQSDPNRPQMDPEEFDFNDNTQEIQLNYTRGEPSDVWFGAATGMTSATRLAPPGLPSRGNPDPDITGEGVTPPGGEAAYDFKVTDNPGNYRMRATASGVGDCTLTLLRKDGDKYTQVGTIDAGFVGAEEELNVFNPTPGDWRIAVGDFLACGQHTWKIDFSFPFLTMGAADTWTNEREDASGSPANGSPTGWAITNIGPKAVDGWNHAADAGGSSAITLDILNLGQDEVDVSPGFVRASEGSTGGTLPINVGKASTLEVPVYNNGGKAVKDVAVSLRTAAGQVIGSKVIGSIGGYDRAIATFTFTPVREGAGEVVATVDPADAIAEVHEGNNVQETRLLVGPANPQVLIVDDDGSYDAEDTYAGALTALGIPFAVAQGHADLATIKKYKAVIWESGLERYQGQLNSGDRDAIRKYLDGGGRVWFLSPRAASALGGIADRTNPGGGTGEMIGLLRDYFGASYVDTLQVGGGVVKGTGDAIGGKLQIKTDVFPGRPLQDVFDVATSAIGTAKKVLDWEKGPAIGMRVEGDAAHKKFRTVYFGLNLSQVMDGNDQVTLVKQVMTWLGVTTGTYKPALPVVYHTQTRTRVAREATILNVYSFGGSTPTAFYRAKGAGGWQVLTLKPSGITGLYEGTIPGAWATLRGLEYFIRAGTMYEPASAPNVANYVSVAPPEVTPPQVAGVKIVRGAPIGSSTGSRSDLPATGVGSGLLGLVAIAASVVIACWMRRRRLA